MGYLLRLATLNRYDTPSWILQLAEIKSYVQSKLSFAFDSSLNLSPLVKLTGVGKDKLAALMYAPVNSPRKTVGDYLVFGSPVPLYMIRLRYPKICPECLGETGYVRKLWELSPVTTCPLHRCMLLDECPSCGERIPWCRPHIDRCRCDFSWREYRTPQVRGSGLQVTQQIYGLCDQAIPLTPSDTLQTSNPLRHLELKHLLSALFFVASQFKGTIDTKGKYFTSSTRNPETHILLRKAWEVFESWPNKYFEFLNWRRTQVAKARSASGLLRDFAEYKSALYKQLASAQFDFMRVAFEEYLTSHWDGGYVSHLKRLDKAARRNWKYASRREAKELLKVGAQSIDHLIAVGKLKAIVRKQDKARLILIERDSLLGFKSALDQSLYLKQVQELLGLSHRRVLELVTYSLLKPLRGPSVDGCSDWRFSGKEVKGLLEQIKEKVMLRTSVGRSGSIDFLMALRKLRRSQVSMGQFISCIIDGAIHPCGISAKRGLPALQFFEWQVTEYAYRQARSQEGNVFCFAARV
jgi:hypothetical protein